VPIDRAAVDLVWSPGGYPSHAAYRDHYHRTARDHHPWANDGAVYDPARAAEQAARDAADFVARVAARVADGGLCVCALDTELLGAWWHEGPRWLAVVVEEAARAGLELVHLDDARGRLRPGAGGRRGATASRAGGRPATSRPGRARAWPTSPGPRARPSSTCSPPVAASATALCGELLALQSSDWAFLASAGTAGDYPRERFAGHERALRAALADPELEPALRNLAPRLARAALLEP